MVGIERNKIDFIEWNVDFIRKFHSLTLTLNSINNRKNMSFRTRKDERSETCWKSGWKVPIKLSINLAPIKMFKLLCSQWQKKWITFFVMHSNENIYTYWIEKEFCLTIIINFGFTHDYEKKKHFHTRCARERVSS